MLVAPLLFAALPVLVSTGCRGRAQRDLYEAKMAHEIRVLEDQLYEADYHNRVLIDKLEQIRLKSQPASNVSDHPKRSYETIPAPVPEPKNLGNIAPEPIGDPLPDDASTLTPPELPATGEGKALPSDPTAPDNPPRQDANSLNTENQGAENRGKSNPLNPKDPIDAGNLDMDDLDSLVDDGQPVDPSEIKVPDSKNPFADDPALQMDSGQDESRSDAEIPSDRLLPAPGGPVPPGKSDTIIPPVLPGEILPPSTQDEQDNKPPGQIVLPDILQDGAMLQEGVGVPDQLRLHPSLSGGHRVEGQIEQMIVVATVLDALGRPLNLTEHDVEGKLSVMIFDADQEETDGSALGVWEFAEDRLKDLIRAEPINGIHIPIQWQERHPRGEEIVVQLRLSTRADEKDARTMNCRGRLKVERANAVAEWTPRGELLK